MQLASLKAAIRVEPTISDIRVCYESIISHHEEMPLECVEELDVGVVAQFSFSICCLPPYKQIMNEPLCPRGHLKVGYMRVIEIWACEHQILPMSSLCSFDDTTNRRTLPRDCAWRFGRRYAHTTLDISAFRQKLNDLSLDRLLVHVPPLAEFDPLAEVEDLDGDQGSALAWRVNHVRRGSDFKALDTTVIVSRPEYGPGASFSFISEHVEWVAQGMLETHLVSITDYNQVSQFYEVARLKLAMARVDVVPLHPFVDHAMEMDRTRPHCAPLVFFCILSQYLLLSVINGYGSLQLVTRVKQMARRRMLFLLILVETLTWLGDSARDSSSVLGLMGSSLLLQRVIVSSYMLCVPPCGLTIAVAYYPNRVARQYGQRLAVPDYTRFEDMYHSQLQAYSEVGAASESADLLIARFLLGPDM
ncbi:hypothetical protein JCGZ_24228 [Jatropha curcas]|uniref:Aminotransferase-like plant mobile domain-containing protein n=1 Tax=Jatropha curcas TaxID=180498 RepID=A0A067L4I2_JATCU|nr:hypothetical protein JCGZ_24228 [Jatropha curcas]